LKHFASKIDLRRKEIVVAAGTNFTKEINYSMNSETVTT
jgi:hypothetical protein